MSIIQTVKSYFSSESETAQLYSCENCSNLFTKGGDEADPGDVDCPNCHSSEVELAVR